MWCGFCKYFIFDDIIFQVGEEEGGGREGGREGGHYQTLLQPLLSHAQPGVEIYLLSGEINIFIYERKREREGRRQQERWGRDEREAGQVSPAGRDNSWITMWWGAVIGQSRPHVISRLESVLATTDRTTLRVKNDVSPAWPGGGLPHHHSSGH